jgi:glucose/arabinose dehydrogenase
MQNSEKERAFLNHVYYNMRNSNLICKTSLLSGTLIVTGSVIVAFILYYLLFNSPVYTSDNVALASASNVELPRLSDPNLKVEEVVNGLEMPTTMAFVGPDDFLVLQKDGKVFRVINERISPEPLLQIPVAKGYFQGLLGIATTKNMPHNSTLVFLYYTEASTKQNNNDTKDLKSNISFPLGNRVYRYQLLDNKLINPVMLLDLPARPGPRGNGGFITIGPDSNLYIVIGGVSNGSATSIQALTQNFVNSTIADGRAGILRTTLDGRPVLDEKGHGILGDSYPLNLYYSYGLQNGFGMDFDPITGNLWNTEVGNITNDEINIVKPGFNSGYAVVQGFSPTFPATSAALVNFNGRGIYHDPELVWEQKVVPTGLKFLTSDKLGPKYRNDIFVGTFLDDGKLYHFKLDQNRDHLLLPGNLGSKVVRTWNDTAALKDIVFGTGFGGISSLTVGPDGYLYVVSVANGKIYRIMPNN